MTLLHFVLRCRVRPLPKAKHSSKVRHDKKLKKWFYLGPNCSRFRSFGLHCRSLDTKRSSIPFLLFPFMEHMCLHSSTSPRGNISCIKGSKVQGKLSHPVHPVHEENPFECLSNTDDYLQQEIDVRVRCIFPPL